MKSTARVAAWAFAAVSLAASAIEPPVPATAPPEETDQAAEQPAPDAMPPAEPAAVPPAEGEAGQETAPAPAAPTEGEEELPPLPATTQPSGPPPQRFNPTEKVRADFPVSFPIDI